MVGPPCRFPIDGDGRPGLLDAAANHLTVCQVVKIVFPRPTCRSLRERSMPDVRMMKPVPSGGLRHESGAKLAAPWLSRCLAADPPPPAASAHEHEIRPGMLI